MPVLCEIWREHLGTWGRVQVQRIKSYECVRWGPTCRITNRGGESSLSLALTLTTSNSSESDSCSVCASIGAEETQPWDEALNLSSEGRDKAVPVSNRSLCEHQDCRLRWASAAAGPEPRGTRAWPSSRALPVHAPLPNRQHWKNMCIPTR